MYGVSKVFEGVWVVLVLVLVLLVLVLLVLLVLLPWRCLHPRLAGDVLGRLRSLIRDACTCIHACVHACILHTERVGSQARSRGCWRRS